jgi:hypothetical protein
MVYCVVSDLLEPPRGSHLTLLPGPVEAGDLVLFDFAGFLIAGRWWPNLDGHDHVIIPGCAIKLTGKIPVRSLGKLIEAEPLTFTQIGRGFPGAA